MPVRLPRSTCLVAVFLQVALLPWAQQAPLSQSSSSSPSSSAKRARKPSSSANSAPDLGSVSNGSYRNQTFGFDFKIPIGWVQRTEEMNASEGQAASQDGQAAPDRTAERGCPHTCGAVLLAAFSRPPEAQGEEVNSAIVIAAESTAVYPGLTDAGQYFGSLTEAATAHGSKVVNQPYRLLVGTKMLVRGDFEKEHGTRVMRQSTLVTLAHGYAVSFTFIGQTEEEVEELIGDLGFVEAKTTVGDKRK